MRPCDVISHLRLTSFTGVLYASFREELEPRPFFEFEVHARLERDGAANRGCNSARVEHLVIRIDTLQWWFGFTHSFMSSMSRAVATLLFLETVTFETFGEGEAAELVQRLLSLRRSGKLRQRTCEEGRKVAQEACCDTGTTTQKQAWPVVSPLWCLDEYIEQDHKKWCVCDLRQVS